MPNAGAYLNSHSEPYQQVDDSASRVSLLNSLRCGCRAASKVFRIVSNGGFGRPANATERGGSSTLDTYRWQDF